MTKEIKIFLGIILGLVVGIGGLIIWSSKTPGKYDDFAQCIADSGTVFYGTYWCPHCAAQKQMFGKSADKLPYAECALEGSEKAASDAAIRDAIRAGKLKTDPAGNINPTDAEALGIKIRTDICKQNNIVSYPTWIFTDGTRVTGEQQLEALAAKTSCALPE